MTRYHPDPPAGGEGSLREILRFAQNDENYDL